MVQVAQIHTDISIALPLPSCEQEQSQERIVQSPQEPGPKNEMSYVNTPNAA